MSTEPRFITAPVKVFLTTQKGDFVKREFVRFKSTVPLDRWSRVINVPIDTFQRKTPLNNILETVCEIIVESNSSVDEDNHIAVKIGQGVNLWEGEVDSTSGLHLSRGHKTMNCKPLYSDEFRSDEEECVWVMKRDPNTDSTFIKHPPEAHYFVIVSLPEQNGAHCDPRSHSRDCAIACCMNNARRMLTLMRPSEAGKSPHLRAKDWLVQKCDIDILERQVSTAKARHEAANIAHAARELAKLAAFEQEQKHAQQAANEQQHQKDLLSLPFSKDLHATLVNASVLQEEAPGFADTFLEDLSAEDYQEAGMNPNSSSSKSITEAIVSSCFSMSHHKQKRTASANMVASISSNDRVIKEMVCSLALAFQRDIFQVREVCEDFMRLGGLENYHISQINSISKALAEKAIAGEESLSCLFNRSSSSSPHFTLRNDWRDRTTFNLRRILGGAFQQYVRVKNDATEAEIVRNTMSSSSSSSSAKVLPLKRPREETSVRVMEFITEGEIVTIDVCASTSAEVNKSLVLQRDLPNTSLVKGDEVLSFLDEDNREFLCNIRDRSRSVGISIAKYFEVETTPIEHFT